MEKKTGYSVGVSKEIYEKYKLLSKLTGKKIKELFDESAIEYMKPYEKLLKTYEVQLAELQTLAHKKMSKVQSKKNNIEIDIDSISTNNKVDSNFNENIIEEIEKKPLKTELKASKNPVKEKVFIDENIDKNKELEVEKIEEEELEIEEEIKVEEELAIDTEKENTFKSTKNNSEANKTSVNQKENIIEEEEPTKATASGDVIDDLFSNND